MARNELEATLTAEEQVNIKPKHCYAFGSLHLLTNVLQRFVLGEMIKSSSIDVEHIANFVKSNDITPDWMNMQLPRGKQRLCFRLLRAAPFSHHRN